MFLTLNEIIYRSPICNKSIKQLNFGFTRILFERINNGTDSAHSMGLVPIDISQSM